MVSTTSPQRSAENQPLVAPVFITFGGPQAHGRLLAVALFNGLV